jgi:hypothetical protein
MRLAACIPVADGIDELLHADARWIVVRTLQGNVLALPAGGGAAVELRSDGEHHTVWAATEGGVVWMLDAGEVMRTVHYGPDRHFIGAGFGLRAVRLLDGQPTWRADLNVAPPAVVCEPVRCGPLWLLTVSEADRVRVLGFEADTGRQAFQVELPGGHSPQPVPLVIEGGRVVLGVDGQSVALQPGEALPAVPSPSRPDPW